MKYEERIPQKLFQEDGHYLGRPAYFSDRIISRRVRLVEAIENFTGKGNTLLEIGCGNGASMFLLSDKMEKCVGIEISDEYQDQFNEYKSRNNIDNCEYTIMDVVHNAPGEQYDRIISFEVIEHLSNENGLNFYFEALKDNGILPISVPNKWWVFETHGASLPLLPWNRIPFFSWLPHPIHERWAHERIYTKRSIKNLLEKHGFEVLTSSYVTAPMDVLPGGKVQGLDHKEFL